MLVIPTKPLPNQQLQVQLGNQSCTLNVYQLVYGLFMDVLSNNALIKGGVICQDRNRIVRAAYLGFDGDFAWLDTTGAGTDPVYYDLGTRYQLLYLAAADVLSF